MTLHPRKGLYQHPQASVAAEPVDPHGRSCIRAISGAMYGSRVREPLHMQSLCSRHLYQSVDTWKISKGSLESWMPCRKGSCTPKPVPEMHDGSHASNLYFLAGTLPQEDCPPDESELHSSGCSACWLCADASTGIMHTMLSGRIQVLHFSGSCNSTRRLEPFQLCSASVPLRVPSMPAKPVKAPSVFV